MHKGWMVIGVCACVIGAGLYYSMDRTLGLCAGALWGYANFFFIRQLLQQVLVIKPRNSLKILLLMGIKFPVLYVCGYGLLLIEALWPWGVLIGFSLVLIGFATRIVAPHRA